MTDFAPPFFDPVQPALITDQEVTFIGDVHGWQTRLQAILPHCRGHIVFVGDLIDRGPQSREVVATARRLVDDGRASVIMGNHEYALVRGLGLQAEGIPGHQELFNAWRDRYGGDITMRSYQVDPYAAGARERLRATMAEHLDFLAQLPWYLWGEAAGHPWLCVHAGLDERPYQQQLRECAPRERWLRNELPRFLYAKDRSHSRAEDLPEAICLVSGHTPQSAPVVTRQRLLTDTSGGRLRRQLSAVIWPTGTIIQS